MTGTSWKLRDHGGASDNHHGFDIVPEAGSPQIAYVNPIDPGGIEGRTNARLIAAAPLMLEALENLENDNGSTMPASAWWLVMDAIEAATGVRPKKGPA
ncbi:MAG: hypothetical protein LC687_08360 [Actinobacteria bacterium]|nr:hypothetical protein [Actinomycetota bacterium]